MIMSAIRMMIVVILTIMVTSCAATPPGKLKESDFLSREIVMEIPVSKAVSQLREGLRYCGPSSGGAVFVTHHGEPECSPVQEDGSVLCDMYIGSPYNGRSAFVLGRIEIKPSNIVGTTAYLRVQTYVANKKNILKSWEWFLLGRAKDVCP